MKSTKQEKTKQTSKKAELSKLNMFFEDTNLPLAAWFLLGLIAYVVLVFFCFWVRYCVLNHALCPKSACLLHCTYYCYGCMYPICVCKEKICSDLHYICSNCSQRQSECSLLCCRRQHRIRNDCNFECYIPNCKEINCLCCRFVFDKRNRNDFVEMDEIVIGHM